MNEVIIITNIYRSENWPILEILVNHGKHLEDKFDGGVINGHIYCLNTQCFLELERRHCAASKLHSETLKTSFLWQNAHAEVCPYKEKQV